MAQTLKIKKRLFEKRTPTERAVFSVVFVVFALVAVFYLYIILWAVLAGFKTHNEIIMNPFGLPTEWQFQNYFEIFRYMEVAGYGYFGMLFNSLYFSVGGPFITIMCTSLLSYTCTKYRFPGSRLFYPVIMIMMTLPLYGNTGSLYVTLLRLNLIDSYAHIILAFQGVNSWFLYFNATYTAISDSYGEAAILDGANDFQVYFKVMLPQARNLMLALFIIAWVADWNNYSGILLYLPNIPTLAGGIYLIEMDIIYDVRYDMLYAAYVVAAIPPLVIFALFNNVLTNSISLGGIKE